MYTFEIKKYLNDRNNVLTYKDLGVILNKQNNPQIIYVEWKDFCNSFYVRTIESADGKEYFDDFEFYFNDDIKKVKELYSGLRDYFEKRDYKLIAKESIYLMVELPDNLKVSYCRWDDKDKSYYYIVEVKNHLGLNYHESYIYHAYTSDYKRENGQIVLRDESSKEENIAKKR